MSARVVRSPQVLLFGAAAAGPRLAAELASAGMGRVVLLGSASATRSGLLDDVRADALADVDIVAEFTRVQPHAPMDATHAIVEAVGQLRADGLVAVGGGSVSDTAKAVALGLAEGLPISGHCTVFTPPDRLEAPDLRRPKLPVVAVPTTLSGAEMTPGGGSTTAAGHKRAFWDPRLAAAIVAYDPAVLARTPADLLLTTAMNGVAHCAEGLYSRTANGYADALALRAAELFARHLPPLASGRATAEAYEALGEASALAGLVIANARTALHHAICHVLGARHGIPHGVANAVMLPHVLRFNRSHSAEPQRRFARALTGAEGDAADAVAGLQARLGVPRRLRDLGLARGDLPGIAASLMSERGLYFNPRPVTSPADVEEVLLAAW